MTDLLDRRTLLDRRLPLAGTFNVREIRDYQAAGGRRLRPGLLYRADALHRLDDAGRAALRARGLRTVVDLRQRAERETQPDLLDGVGATVVECPIFERGDEAVAGAVPDLSTLYRRLVSDRGQALAGAIAAVARPSALPVLIHCTAGKDRTGIVIALLLSALGVHDGAIAADFAVTELCLGDRFRDQFLARATDTGLDPALLASLLGSDPALARQVLAQVRAEDGSAAAYLTRNGLAATDLELLRTELLTPPIVTEPGGQR